ncbi:MAG TPA: DEAD/DEAH box helicase [Gemmatimonadaceae bacterium]|nr:DEAD/DEAH box helicase [Gemmatimonadaceae bacterium]
MHPLIVPAATARALIARRILGEEHAPARAGSVVLRPHQQSAVDRLRGLLRRHGGALLADDVGLGKTYVAAALLREARRPLVVAPAALRDMWQRALHATGARALVVSYTALGRDDAPAGPFDFIVMDEAHHARTPATRRYARLAALAARAPVLLLTATPIHNARRDLAALIALFLGAQAYTLSDAALAQYIVRRERSDVRGVAIPQATEPRWLAVGDDSELLGHILELPPPLPPADGGSGGALLAWSLVRQWASSTGALVGALRRRLVRAAALDAALAQQHRLTRRELSDWVCGDDAVQLAIPGLFAALPVDDHALREVLATHVAALRELLRRAQASDAADATRARRLSDIRAWHPGEKIVAFSQFADTIHAMFRLLRNAAGIAALTGHGARVAGGSLTRAEALARFAPRASGARPPRAIERIDLLLTTDLLSEGINLSDASVVVHLDLPWTGARLEQRVGRSRRIGASHQCTSVYALAPPASSEELLRVEARVRAKLRAASRATGIAGTILPGLAAMASDESAARTRERIRAVLGRWRERAGVTPAPAHTLPPPPAACPAPPASTPHPESCIASAVRATRPVLLVVLREGTGDVLSLAALDDGELQADPAMVLRALLELDGGDAAAPVNAAYIAEPANADHVTVPPDVIERAVATAQRWIERHRAALATGASLTLHAPARRSALRRISIITARAPLHRRPELAALAAGARRAVSVPCGVGAEAVLGEIARAPMPDEAWLRALAAFGDAHGARGAEDAESAAGAREHGAGNPAPRVIAMLVGVPERGAS